MRYLHFLLVAGASVVLQSCNGTSEETKKQNEAAQLYAEHMRMDGLIGEKAKAIFKPLEAVAVNAENEVTDAKVKLGKVLYFDKRLSKEGNISCNSCHNLNTGGVDNLPFSPGDDGTLGGRNSPTVLNAAFHTMQFWDGRAKDVEEQAGMPVLNPVEMMIPSEAFLIDRLKGIELYKELFTSAYPSESQPISYTNLRKAIGAFERTLVTPSRFDEYLAGNSQALSIEEKEGMQVFMETGCITCHSGAQLGGHMFQKFGVYADYWTATGSAKVDEGRAEVTKVEADRYMFKVPSLRNVEKTWPYFHDGSVKELEQAVAIMAEINLNKQLSEQEVGSIVTFLKALNGELPAGVADEPAELKAQS